MCTVEAATMGKEEGEFFQVRYPVEGDSCPQGKEGVTSELGELIGKEYDRLGTDGVNSWVRDVLLWEHERHGGSRGDFSVLDVGCGLGGTLYSIAAKGLGLNEVVSAREEAVQGSGGGFWGSGRAGKARVKYQGITLSSAEVIMARKEATKRNLNFPRVKFDQMSFDDPALKKLEQFSFAVAIESLSKSANLTATLINLRESMAPGGVMVVVDFVALQPEHNDLDGIDMLNRPLLYTDGGFHVNAEKNDWSKRNDFKTGKSVFFDGKSKFFNEPSDFYKSHLEEFGGVRRKEEWLKGFEDAGWAVSDVKDIGTMFELLWSAAGHKAGINEGWNSVQRRTNWEGFLPPDFASFLEQVGKCFYKVKFYLVKACNRLFRQDKSAESINRELTLGIRSAQIKEMMSLGNIISGKPEALWHGYIEAIRFAPSYTQKLLEIWYDENQAEQRLIAGAIGNDDMAMMGFVVRA